MTPERAAAARAPCRLPRRLDFSVGASRTLWEAECAAGRGGKSNFSSHPTALVVSGEPHGKHAKNLAFLDVRVFAYVPFRVVQTAAQVTQLGDSLFSGEEGRTMQVPKTLDRCDEQLPDDEACLEALPPVRWTGGFACPELAESYLEGAVSGGPPGHSALKGRLLRQLQESSNRSDRRAKEDE